MSAEKKANAEALVRLQQSNDGQAFLKEVHNDFDKAMRNFLFSPPEEIFKRQGVALGYHYVLKKFEDAHKEANS